MQQASVTVLRCRGWPRRHWWWCFCWWWWWCCCCWWCSGGAVAAWNTTRLYGTPLRARLADVAVWRNRAYACWPRLDAAQPVTLLELPWPETEERRPAERRRRRRLQRREPSRASSARWKPRGPFHADQQKLYDCRHVQSAVALDLDRIRGHLYVLDSGYDSGCCQPKIVVYDLKTSRCIHSMELAGLNGSELTALVVDARPVKGETRAYAGNARGGYLVAFDPARSVWYRVTLSRARPDETRHDETDVPAECVAVSKTHSSVFFTSKRSHNFYTASFRDLRNLTSYVTPGLKNGDVFRIGLRVRWGGVKLGRSSGLYVDMQGGLNYVYTRDFVAVRLPSVALGDDVEPATAEDHEVLLQSYDLLPAVTKIFTDNANYLHVWALNAVPNAENRHSVKINTLTF